MSQSSDQQTEVEQIGFLENLPAKLNGWHREPGEEDDRYLRSYWRRGSSHVAGVAEQLYLHRGRNTVNLSRAVYDQFRHVLSTQTLTTQDTVNEWVVQRLKRHTEKHPGGNKYSGPPTFPDRVGEWTAITRQNYNRADATRWVFDPQHAFDQTGDYGKLEDVTSLEPADHAILSLRETEIEHHYSYSRRHWDVNYADPAVGSREIATDVPRTGAFELATNTLRSLHAPVSGMESERERLKGVPGIGPAKAVGFCLLGITAPAQIRQQINADRPPVNHHHEDRFEALLTSRIQESVGR